MHAKFNYISVQILLKINLQICKNYFEFKSDLCESNVNLRKRTSVISSYFMSRVFGVLIFFSFRFQKQSHFILTQVCVMCVCEVCASDVSVIVSAYDGVRPQPRGVPTGESSRPSQGDWVLPRRAKWLSSSWARGHRGSLPPIATVCTP